MSGFVDYIGAHELDCETNLHQHFFGGPCLQRRGRLKWKIGITRQIIAQRRKKGVRKYPVDSYLLPLARYKQLYKIKRSVRLWHYMYLSLRLRNPLNVANASPGGQLFHAFSSLAVYLRDQQCEHPMHHSILLCEEASNGARLSIPRVEDLETNRIADIAMDKAINEVVEHVVGRRGLTASCIQAVSYTHLTLPTILLV